MNSRETRAVEDAIYLLTQGYASAALHLLRHLQQEQLELMSLNGEAPSDRTS